MLRSKSPLQFSNLDGFSKKKINSINIFILTYNFVQHVIYVFLLLSIFLEEFFKNKREKVLSAYLQDNTSTNDKKYRLKSN